MLKTNEAVVLGAVAIGGLYFLSKNNVFKGIADATAGAGAGFTGIGKGAGELGETIGHETSEVIRDTSRLVQDVIQVPYYVKDWAGDIHEDIAGQMQEYKTSKKNRAEQRAWAKKDKIRRLKESVSQTVTGIKHRQIARRKKTQLAGTHATIRAKSKFSNIVSRIKTEQANKKIARVQAVKQVKATVSGAVTTAKEKTRKIFKKLKFW